jgi:predicted nucleotidyltransferase
MHKSFILEYLNCHKEEFEKRFDVIKIGLFGSYARDEATDNSDIDILIELKKTANHIYEKKRELKAMLEKAFNKKVDIAREKYLKPFIKEDVLKETCYV